MEWQDLKRFGGLLGYFGGTATVLRGDFAPIFPVVNQGNIIDNIQSCLRHAWRRQQLLEFAKTRQLEGDVNVDLRTFL